MAEYFRDERGQDVLLFIDNIFRFVQAGSEVSALLGRMPSAVGYQPTLATEMGELQERITSTNKGSITSVQAIYVPGRRPHRPGARPTTFAHLDATTVLSRAISEKGIYPAVDPLDSTSRILQPGSVSTSTTDVATRVQQVLQRYKDLQDIIAILGMDELSDEDKVDRAARPQDRAVPVAAVLRGRGRSPARRASTCKLEDTIRCFQEVLDGKHDELPEQAFYLVGGIDDVLAARRRADGHAPDGASTTRIRVERDHAGGRRCSRARPDGGRARQRRRARHHGQPRAAGVAA